LLVDNLSQMKTDQRKHACIAALLTPEEVMGILRVSKTTLYRLVERRTLPFLKVGGVLRFSEDDLASYLHGKRVDSVEKWR